MRTILEIPTKGDSMTLPGGIALRGCEDTHEYVVHNYSTDRETQTARAYFQGSYYPHDGGNAEAEAFSRALQEFSRRVDRATGYDQGGAVDFEALFGKEVQAS